MRYRAIGYSIVLLIGGWIGVLLDGFAQGFPWTPSARLPFDHPRWYIGVTTGYGVQYHFGRLENLEGQLLCGVYRSGSGQQWELGVVTEYWDQPQRAWKAMVRWTTQQVRFTDRSDPIPQKDTEGNTLEPLITEYELQTRVQMVQLVAQLKQRVIVPRAFLSGGISITVITESQMRQYERIISPPERRFVDGSYERQLPTQPVDQLSLLNVGVVIGAGLDVPIAYRIYVVPSIRLDIPFFPIHGESQWRSIGLAAQLDLFIGW